jgi:hypothetical protein
MTASLGPKGGLTIEHREQNDEKLQRRFGHRAARDLLGVLLREWGECNITKHGRTVRITTERKGLIVELNKEVLRRELSPASMRIVQVLLDELNLQSWVAKVAVRLAKAEMETQVKRLAGAARGGKAAEKPVRSTVERLMRAQLRQKQDPRRYFATWSEEYGYSVPQLRNILRAVRAETP